MSAASGLSEFGVLVSAKAGDVKLNGLSKLNPEEAKGIIEYAKKHKTEILAELTMSEAEQLPDNPKCLGIICNYVQYQNMDGSPCLWCQHENKLVLDMPECPHGAWAKDANGFPMPDNPNKRMIITNGR